ncbi:hypothetical protein [Falsibacillus pallidus]|uniref:hypothetical protein n=1 Tax=Falsibacillus pallidus TaxID=493781 RepID=UPI003D9737D3
MKELDKLEAILWSIALPGFPQLLAGSLVKGILFVFLEILFNMMSHFNKAIMLSFLGETGQASEIVDYQWLMFYPCLYMFAMWDAYKLSLKEKEPYTYLPFAFGAYLVTVGLMYAPKVYLFNLFPGPVFLPILALLPGLGIGFLIRSLIVQKKVD